MGIGCNCIKAFLISIFQKVQLPATFQKLKKTINQKYKHFYYVLRIKQLVFV